MQECRKLPVIAKFTANVLCSHVNNIYNKLSEIQQQLPHSTQHMNTGDVIQIEVPDFDPDIDKTLPTQEHQEAQGSASITQQFCEKSAKSKAPALSHHDIQDVDWPDPIPVEILPQPDQDIEQSIPASKMVLGGSNLVCSNISEWILAMVYIFLLAFPLKYLLNMAA